eukprot:5303684-Pleurochrysis_carterae.AAC.1
MRVGSADESLLANAAPATHTTLHTTAIYACFAAATCAGAPSSGAGTSNAALQLFRAPPTALLLCAAPALPTSSKQALYPQSDRHIANFRA